MIVDLFAGPGGWDLGALQLGVDPIGVELDPFACQTRTAAGLTTVKADVMRSPLNVTNLRGLIGSPPCPAFSTAGNGDGVDHIPAMIAALDGDMIGPEWSHLVGDHTPAMMTLEPFVWARKHMPEWIALEQVPPVLPIWQAGARMLDRLGYRTTWVGVLNAADYGVAQTRRRAILMAHRDRVVHPPAATHDDDPHPALFGADLLPWVSMWQALCFARCEPGIGSEAIMTGGDWAWTQDRPATTVCGDSRLWPPGHKINADDIARLGEEEANARYGDRAGTEAIRLTLEQGLTLQSFPTDWPLAGSNTQRWNQVGNAVPPVLAYHILRELV